MRKRRTDVCLPDKDAEFFQSFYEANIRRLYCLVRKSAVPESEVMDVVQDVLERLMKNIPALRKYETEPGKQVGFVRVMVDRICIDRYRKAVRTPCDTYAPAELEELVGLQQSRESTDAMELEDDILCAKNLMTEQEWQMVSGKFFIGYSDEELAKMYGYSKDSVRTVLSRGLKKARDALKGKGGESNGSRKQ